MENNEGKRQLKQQQSTRPSRSPSPQPAGEVSPDDDDYQPVTRTPPPTRAGPPPSPPVPTNPIAPVAPEPSGPMSLIPCQVCGRTFVSQSLSKHVKICEKMAIKRRKTFDSSRQRREGLVAANGANSGTDLEQYLPKNFGLPENSPFLEKSPPPTAKPVSKAPSKQSVRSAISKPMAELQKCPHCTRAFGVRAFERHVEWCADKAKILPAAPAQPPPHVASAKQRLNARTQYKAPLARGRKSSQTRDKSSNSRSASVESSRDISPPREFGDYRHGLTRTTESVSSNDCHEDTSPHVPVIRNSRNSQNNSSGDANVKARQARLARDISSSRIDDTYDPFISAARQMKELMSSDTNIPKKISTSSKDLNRTLPSLRNTKDNKGPSSFNNNNNTKMMKDTLNKSYQKTPTLQRMKSFGSTNNDNNNVIGARCSSFRMNRNDNSKKSSQKLNSTFTKSSKENISTTDKFYFNRNSNLNRSFSSYTASSYSTPKPKDKIPKITTSLYHSFQRTTIKQPVKLDKIKREEVKKSFVNLDSILTDDNSSMTDSSYIDPRLINENDNLPINVNTIRNNPDIISSMESLLTTENLPSKFESFSSSNLNDNIRNRNGINTNSRHKIDNKLENNNNVNKTTAPIIEDLSSQYDKIMSSLEQSIASKTSVRDDESLCEDFDLEEFMTSFDEEIIKHKLENKRTCSSTTRVVKQSELADSNKSSEFNSVSSTPKIPNGMIPVNKSMSLTFSSNNIVNESLFPSSVKRSTSFLDSIQKKGAQKVETRSRQKTDQLEQDLMQSLKDFDKFYAAEKKEINTSTRETMKHTSVANSGTAKRDTRVKSDRKKKDDNVSNGNFTPNGKPTNDSAYSRLVSLNRISPSKLSLCASKEPNGLPSVEQTPTSDSSGHKDETYRSGDSSSDEFLAMERSAELDAPKPKSDIHPPFKELENHAANNHTEKRASSRASCRRSPTWRRGELSSSGSEASLHRPRRDSAPAPPPRLSRFCHECGTRFSVDSAKFCIECGVKRLAV